MQIAIVGGGYIVPEFWRAADATAAVRVCGIWARRAEVREELAAAHGVTAYPTYEALLADPAVEAIYLALSNTAHYAYAMRALAAGKHILIEKPVTVQADNARALFAEAEKRGRIVFEMITNRYNPFCDEIAARLPELGAIRLAQLNYSQYSSRYDAFCSGQIHPVFNPAMGGGTLLDLNVYNIHLAVRWFGRPSRVTYAANVVRGIDVSGVVLLEYPGMICTCTASKDTSGPCGAAIQGEKGYIHSTAPTNLLDSYTVQLRGAEPESYVREKRASRMCDELDAFCAHYAAKDDAWFAGQTAHSMAVMEVLDAARRGAGMEPAADLQP